MVGYSSWIEGLLSECGAGDGAALHALLDDEAHYAPGEVVLVAGHGEGAHTARLAQRCPGATIHAIDPSPSALASAQRKARAARVNNVRFQQLDVRALPFAPETFDHVFICFALGAIARPAEALGQLRKVLKRGGTITVIEGDQGSAIFHPDSVFARKAIESAIALKAREGINANIGRSLYPLLRQAGFGELRIVPRTLYRDGSRTGAAETVVLRDFAASIQSAAERLDADGVLEPAAWTRGISDFRRTAGADGTFACTFFRAVGKKE